MKKALIFLVLTVISFITLSSFRDSGVGGCFYFGNNEGCTPDLSACQWEWNRAGQKLNPNKIPAQLARKEGPMLFACSYKSALKALNVKDLSNYPLFKIQRDILIPNEYCKLLNLKNGSKILKGDYKYEVKGDECIVTLKVGE